MNLLRDHDEQPLRDLVRGATRTWAIILWSQTDVFWTCLLTTTEKTCIAWIFEPNCNCNACHVRKILVISYYILLRALHFLCSHAITPRHTYSIYCSHHLHPEMTPYYQELVPVIVLGNVRFKVTSYLYWVMYVLKWHPTRTKRSFFKLRCRCRQIAKARRRHEGARHSWIEYMALPVGVTKMEVHFPPWELQQVAAVEVCSVDPGMRTQTAHRSDQQKQELQICTRNGSSTRPKWQPLVSIGMNETSLHPLIQCNLTEGEAGVEAGAKLVKSAAMVPLSGILIMEASETLVFFPFVQGPDHGRNPLSKTARKSLGESYKMPRFVFVYWVLLWVWVDFFPWLHTFLFRTPTLFDTRERKSACLWAKFTSKHRRFFYTYDSVHSPNKLLQLLARERAARTAPISPSAKRPSVKRGAGKRRHGARPSVWWLLEDDGDDDNTDNDDRLLSLMRDQCLEAAQTPIGIGPCLLVNICSKLFINNSRAVDVHTYESTHSKIQSPVVYEHINSFATTKRSPNRVKTFAVNEEEEAKAEADNKTNNQTLRILTLEREARALRWSLQGIAVDANDIRAHSSSCYYDDDVVWINVWLTYILLISPFVCRHRALLSFV